MTDPLGLINTGVGNAGPVRPRPAGPTQDASGPSFKDVLMKNIEQVNKLQQDAAKAVEDLNTRRTDDVAGVLMAQKKAQIAFEMLVQVRNQMVAAYEEIKQMRV